MEREFARLVATLSIKPEAAPGLADHLAKANQQNLTSDRKAEIRSEITLCKQRIQNAEKLFIMARLDEESLNNHIEENERQIMRLQAEMSEASQIKQMIEMTANMLSDMGNSWQESSNEDKQAFAQTMFSEIVFDLDTHRITGFTLKGWAEQFLQVRVAYDGAETCLEGYKSTRLLTAEEAMQCLLDLLYAGRSLQRKTFEKRERNAEIYRRYLAGEDSTVLARVFGLSDRRIRNIIERERKRAEQ